MYAYISGVPRVAVRQTAEYLRTRYPTLAALPDAEQELTDIELYKNATNMTFLVECIPGTGPTVPWYEMLEITADQLQLEPASLRGGKARIRIQGSKIDPQEGCEEVMILSVIPPDEYLAKFIEDLYRRFTPAGQDIEMVKSSIMFRKWSKPTQGTREFVSYLQMLVNQHMVEPFKEQWKSLFQEGEWIETPTLGFQARVWSSARIMLEQYEQEQGKRSNQLFTTSTYTIKSFDDRVEIADIERAHAAIPLFEDLSIPGAYTFRLVKDYSGSGLALRVSTAPALRTPEGHINRALQEEPWTYLGKDGAAPIVAWGNECPDYRAEQLEARAEGTAGLVWHKLGKQIDWTEETKGAMGGSNRRARRQTNERVTKATSYSYADATKSQGDISGPLAEKIEARMRAMENTIRAKDLEWGSVGTRVQQLELSVKEQEVKQRNMTKEIDNIRKDTRTNTNSILGLQAEISNILGSLTKMQQIIQRNLGNANTSQQRDQPSDQNNPAKTNSTQMEWEGVGNSGRGPQTDQSTTSETGWSVPNRGRTVPKRKEYDRGPGSPRPGGRPPPSERGAESPRAHFDNMNQAFTEDDGGGGKSRGEETMEEDL